MGMAQRHLERLKQKEKAAEQKRLRRLQERDFKLTALTRNRWNQDKKLDSVFWPEVKA